MSISKPLIVLVLAAALLARIAPSGNALSPAANSITPGTPRTDATFQHIGVLWPVDGDDDLDSSMTLEFRRQGDVVWQSGAPAMRAYPSIIVDGEALNLNYWAASAMFLAAGQTYELRLSLTDPDGGGATQVITAATRLELQPAADARVRFVVPGSGGGDGSAGNPFLGLPAAAADAQPGDLFKIAAGNYTTFQLLASGAEGKPIVFSGPLTGAAVIDGGAPIAASSRWASMIAPLAM